MYIEECVICQLTDVSMRSFIRDVEVVQLESPLYVVKSSAVHTPWVLLVCQTLDTINESIKWHKEACVSLFFPKTSEQAAGSTSEKCLMTKVY